jgi:hypothetical protein
MEFKSKSEVLTTFSQVLSDMIEEILKAVLQLEKSGYKVENNMIKGSTKLLLVQKLLKSTSVHYVFNHFEKNLLPIEKKIRDKDERFFIETPNIFPVPEEHILFIKDLWRNKSGYGFTAEQKDAISEYILCLLDLIIETKKFS